MAVCLLRLQRPHVGIWRLLGLRNQKRDSAGVKRLSLHRSLYLQRRVSVRARNHCSLCYWQCPGCLVRGFVGLGCVLYFNYSVLRIYSKGKLKIDVCKEQKCVSFNAGRSRFSLVANVKGHVAVYHNTKIIFWSLLACRVRDLSQQL